MKYTLTVKGRGCEVHIGDANNPILKDATPDDYIENADDNFLAVNPDCDVQVCDENGKSCLESLIDAFFDCDSVPVECVAKRYYVHQQEVSGSLLRCTFEVDEFDAEKLYTLKKSLWTSNGDLQWVVGFMYEDMILEVEPDECDMDGESTNFYLAGMGSKEAEDAFIHEQNFKAGFDKE